MSNIKVYKEVSKEHNRSFGISRMEDIYAKRQGVVDLPHRHYYYTILLTKKAQGKHHLDFETYELGNNQVHFITPGQVHQIEEETASEGYSMVFSTDFLVENNIAVSFIDDLNLFRQVGQSPPLELEITQQQKLSAYAENMLTTHVQRPKFHQQALGALLKLFLIECNHFCTLPNLNPQQLEAGSTLLRAFKQLVEQQHKTWHQSNEYAQALHISTDHLNRTIKHLTGLTSKQHIQKRLIIAAKRQLFFSTASTKEIAYELGFSEPANFSAFFKKHTGSSPSKFRQQAGE